MCGITGWVDLQAARSDGSVLEKMNDAAAHRGPDGKGIFLTQTRDGHYSIGLAHRRLSIIDLSTGGQPMRSADGLITLTFNGEIYNFQELREELRALGWTFATTSDTEVLLVAYRAWGVDCLRRFRGMFAFALWDAGREQLFMARDRFGKKPLFLWQEGERLLFASEIKSILAHPAVKTGLDGASVLDFLQYRYVPSPNTMFKGVTKLPPGTYALWQGGKLNTAPYYLPPDGEISPPLDTGDEEKIVGEFLKILDECVSLRMTSDVPFGAFLSGGLDSSAIVALMSRHSNQPINTFSVGFEESQYNEGGYANEIASLFNTRHTEWLMKSEDVISLLPKTISFRDAPMAEPTDVAMYVLSTKAAQSVKMVLTGEGADEILAGYPKHRFEPYVRLYQSLVPGWAHDNLVLPLVDSLPSRFYRIGTLAHSLGLRDAAERYPRWFGSLSLEERNRLSALHITSRPVDTLPFAVTEGASALRRCLYFDQTSWLPDNLLERGDRMTMAGSIETRLPFMDHELAHFVARLPDKFLIRGNTQKWILRQAMASVLPASILKRTKVGFRVPINQWFRTTLKDYVYDHLLSASSVTRDMYHREALTQMLDQHVKGQHNHEKLIWALLNLELFQKQYGLTMG